MPLRNLQIDNTMSPEHTLVVYVDVDDTLVRSVGAKRIPMSRVIEHVKKLHADGAMLYCWSSGGADYARESAKEFGIAACFQAFLPKPHLVIDDQPIADWRLLLEIHPLSIDDKTGKEYWEAIEAKFG